MQRRDFLKMSVAIPAILAFRASFGATGNSNQSFMDSYSENMTSSFGIADVNLIPVRKEPSERAEMVTQILFGEHFKVLQRKGDWVQVKLAYDNYEGWITFRTYMVINSDFFAYLDANPLMITTAMSSLVWRISDNASFTLVPGSYLPYYNPVDKSFHLEHEKYHISDVPVCLPAKTDGGEIVKTARQYLNSPYLWGGRSPFGFDCSGFTQIVFRLNGIKLLRDAHQQADMGNLVSSVNEALPGDLAFFHNKEGRIIHVGIVVENSQIIHCSGRVRINKLDAKGIYDAKLKGYTHMLKSIKRLV